MELELGLKLARVADEFSSADFHVAKDATGPLFLSTETDVSFNLTAYLRGYKKRNVKIEINEDGSQITISGEKAIQEIIFVDWKLHKKETEMRGFRKAFKIPDSVILEKIEANFDEDESMVTVSIPKKEKGIRGFSIEEVKDPVPPVFVFGTSESLLAGDDEPAEKQLPNSDTDSEQTKNNDDDDMSENLDRSSPTCRTALNNDNEITKESQTQEKHLSVNDHIPQESNVERYDMPENLERSSPTCRTAVNNDNEITKESQIQEKHHSVYDHIPQDQSNAERYDPSTILKRVTSEKEEQQEVKASQAQGNEEGRPLDHTDREREEKGNFKISVPAIAGTAFLLSFVVFVIHYIQTKTTPNKRKDI